MSKQKSRLTANRPGERYGDVKRYLAQLQQREEIIKQKIEERKALLTMAAICGGSGFDGMRVQTSGDPEKMARRVSAAVDLEAEISRDIEELTAQRHEIINQIQSLESVPYIQLLFKRYVEYKPLEDIAPEMGYTYDWIRVMHGRALQAFKEKYADCINV